MQRKKRNLKIQKVSAPMPETTNLKLGTKIVQFYRPTQMPEMVDIYNILVYLYVQYSLYKKQMEHLENMLFAKYK